MATFLMFFTTLALVESRLWRGGGLLIQPKIKIKKVTPQGENWVFVCVMVQSTGI